MKTIYLFLITAMMVISIPSTFGQGNGQKGREHGHQQTMKDKEKMKQKPDSLKRMDDDNKDDHSSEMRGKGNRNAPNMKDRQDTLENKEKGNAYGKNKGEMSGREFGQQRAREARRQHQKELDESIKRGREKSSEARERIRDARKKNEQARRAGEVSEEQYEEREKKIEKAEQKVDELEEELEEAEENATETGN